VFAHNGAFGGLDLIEQQLGRFREVVHGDTDSERMFALILAAAADHGGDLEAGIATAIAWLAANVPVLSCNLILTTASDLWALRYPATNELYLLERAAGGHRGHEHLRAAGRHGGIRVHSGDLRDQQATIVASEPLDANPGWTLLKPGELIHVDHRLHLESRALITRPPSRWLTLPDS
jgi:glutamine amidotransferase